jgi:hypothetical protein
LHFTWSCRPFGELFVESILCYDHSAFKKILANGVDINFNLLTRSTALLAAAARMTTQTLASLLKSLDIKLLAPDVEANTFLHLAAGSGIGLNEVKTVLGRHIGQSPGLLNIKNNSGHTAFQVFVRAGVYNIISK